MAKQVVTQAWEQLRRDGVTKGMLMPMILEVTAKVGKRLRAAPVAQLYEQQLVHHVGEYTELEDQMVTWVEGMDSPTAWTPPCTASQSWPTLTSSTPFRPARTTTASKGDGDTPASGNPYPPSVTDIDRRRRRRRLLLVSRSSPW